MAGAAAASEFTAANALFDAGKFGEAIAAYERIEPKTAHVWFNLGNAHYRAGQLGQAVLSYERARQLAPRDPDILANLKFAEQNLGVAEVNTPPQSVRRFVRSVAESRTLGQWSVRQVAGVWLTVAFAGAAVWWPRWRTGLVLIAVVAGVWLLFAAGMLAYRVAAPRGAVVVAPATEGRFAPLADATVHFRLVEGTKVSIREDRGQWLFIERADGQQAWVRAEAMGRMGL